MVLFKTEVLSQSIKLGKSMNNIKHALYISLLFVGYGIQAMDTPYAKKSAEKTAIQREIHNRYVELVNDFNNEVSTAALGINDPEELQAFLARAYSPATQEILKQQAEADVAGLRLAERSTFGKSGMHHTSPEKPKYKKTLPSSRTTQRKKSTQNTPTAKRQLDFD